MPDRAETAQQLDAQSLEALLAILRRHQHIVFAICYQVLHHVQDAEDAVQEILLDLLEEMREPARIRDVQRWVYRVAYCRALDAKRKQMQRKDKEQRAAESAAPGVDPVRFTDDQASELFEHVGRLDEDLRAVVTEHYLGKRTLEAIARDEGVTVKDRYFKSPSRP
jgi:RNA polymerase sigma factor (sigma-70 family)